MTPSPGTEVMAAADKATTLRRSRGRPRSVDCDQAILDAALAALCDEGYGAMSVEGVAARAGVGKATVYRRWRNKAQILVEALRRHACCDVPLVDTGDVRADLLVMLRAVQRSMKGVDGRIMAAFVAERSRHPELNEEFERAFVADRRRHVRKILVAAVRRGDLPAHTDVELLADVGPALLWHRMTMRRAPLSRDLPERIVGQFLPR